jgi:hypothetical protein
LSYELGVKGNGAENLFLLDEGRETGLVALEVMAFASTELEPNK